MRALFSLLVLLVCSSASAHHSFAMYDSAQLIHIKGTVKSFQWTNPHVMVWVVKDEPAGEVWTIELPTSPGNLARTGWSKHSLKPGDPIDVEVNPLRDGQHAGSFKKATLTETGEVLTAAIAGSTGKDAGAAAEPAVVPVDCSDTTDEHAHEAAAVASAEGCACAHNRASCVGPALALTLVGLVLLARRLRRVSAG
ncbi:MAG: DUF6152 family protein [Polyangiales bacterium]